jgi:hypothetical protein
MSATEATTPANSAGEAIALQEFLESVPPGVPRNVSGFARNRASVGHLVPSNVWEFERVDIRLFWPDEVCDRIQNFCSSDRNTISLPEIALVQFDAFLNYHCRNCGHIRKTFAVRVLSRDRGNGTLVKVGEIPEFGPPLPARVQRLFQPERDLLLKGFDCEKNGFGIGAFAYYRRIVEHGKNSLIDQIITACKKIAGAEKFIAQLERAKRQTQFSAAIEEIADAIPDVLKIDNHNPLTLLHRALSKKIHAESDSECLAAAQAIRTVLVALLEKLAIINKEDAEVTDAIRRLMNIAGESKPDNA